MRPLAADLLADPVLGPRLARALSAREWKRAIPSFKPGAGAWAITGLKHRPGRRMSLMLSPREASGGRRWILKLWYNRRGGKIFHRLRSIQEALAAAPGAPLAVPNPEFYLEDAHALAYPCVEAPALAAALRRGAARDWVSPFAGAVAALHGLALPDLPPREPADELRALRERLEGGPAQAGEDDSIREGTAEICRGLAETAPPPHPEASLHRDLYDQQALQLPGGKFYLLDLDDMALGDPMLDLGNFAAHLRLIPHWARRPEKLARARARLLREYARAAGASPEEYEERFAWHEAAALARLALLRADAGDFGRAENVLNAARALLFGAARARGGRG